MGRGKYVYYWRWLADFFSWKSFLLGVVSGMAIARYSRIYDFSLIEKFLIYIIVFCFILLIYFYKNKLKS
ncbi:MAG: hypothetical protein KatS3mg019_1971 [Fimbriimonadales bacterium]|nr:MAG: hypothetical protein KatS3mg019_1971 [Fimbriimonadales bacterium]